jgi:hypothetical protein
MFARHPLLLCGALWLSACAQAPVMSDAAADAARDDFSRPSLHPALPDQNELQLPGDRLDDTFIRTGLAQGGLRDQDLFLSLGAALANPARARTFGEAVPFMEDRVLRSATTDAFESLSFEGDRPTLVASVSFRQLGSYTQTIGFDGDKRINVLSYAPRTVIQRSADTHVPQQLYERLATPVIRPITQLGDLSDFDPGRRGFKCGQSTSGWLCAAHRTSGAKAAEQIVAGFVSGNATLTTRITEQDDKQVYRVEHTISAMDNVVHTKLVQQLARRNPFNPVALYDLSQ